LDRTLRMAHQLAIAYFPNATGPVLTGRLQHLLSCVRHEHRQYADGPLRQTLMVAFLDPLAKHDRRPWRGSRVLLRLQLANGLVYHLRLAGDVGPVLQCLEPFAKWLLQQTYDVEAFDRYARYLHTLADPNSTVTHTCDISIGRAAGMVSAPGISLLLITRTSLAALNRLRTEYGHRPLNRLPDVLKQHFAAMFAATAAATEAYLAGLDQHALALVREFEVKYHRRFDDLRVYNFLVAHDGAHCRNRIQAMRELPWLLRPLADLDSLFSTHPEYPPAPPVITLGAATTILEAIDTARPLFDAVSRAFDLPRETVSWTRGQMLPNTAHFDVHRIRLLLLMLSWLPPEKRPGTDQDWAHMKKVILTLFAVLRGCWNQEEFPDLLLDEPRYGVIFRRWLRELVRPDLAAAVHHLETWRLAGHDAGDMQDYLAALCKGMRDNQKAAKNHGDERGEPQAGDFLAWLGNRSLREIAGFSRRWHAAMHGQFRPEVPVYVPDHEHVAKWPAVLAKPLHADPCEIIELTTSRALAQEGRAMEHCVGGYAAQCVFDNRLIFSVRGVNKLRLSTVELELQEEPLRVCLRQHKGRQNAAPPQSCVTVVESLITTLNSPAFRPTLQARREYQRKMRSLEQKDRERLREHIDAYDRMAQAAAWAVTGEAICGQGQEILKPIAPVFRPQETRPHKVIQEKVSH